MTHLESYIKEIVRKILISSGEPFTTSDIIVDIIYEYICRAVHYIRMHLSTNLPDLRDLLIMCRDQPIRLTRIVKYFRTISQSSCIKMADVEGIDEQLSSFVKDHYDIDDDNDDVDRDGGGEEDDDCNMSNNNNNTEKEANGLRGGDSILLQNSKLVNSLLSNEDTNWLRLNSLLDQLSIPSPCQSELFWRKFNPKLLQIYEKISQGRSLRLLRIDSKSCCSTVEEFLAFSRLRQSASFTSITRSRNFEKFWYWLFYYPLNVNNKDTTIKKKTKEAISSSSPGTQTQTPPASPILLTSKEMREYYLKMRTKSTSSSSARAEAITATAAAATTTTTTTWDAPLHEGLLIVAYLLTGDILDVIDMILFNRQKLDINLSSPITPIEVKEVLRVFRTVLYPV
uniref:Uncharacterized protein n=1 Tax=Trichobilharzia regenti TaxID=157069 RepID=A0AA85IZD1_TRIRE|nr:unnamed protein product [Trichobilharzia regenti]